MDPIEERYEIVIDDPISATGWAAMERVVTFDKRLHNGPYRLLAAIRHYAMEKDVAWPSKGTLADKFGKDPKTIQRWYVELEELGYIQRIYRTGQTSLLKLLSIRKNKPLLELANEILSDWHGGDKNVQRGGTNLPPKRESIKDNHSSNDEFVEPVSYVDAGDEFGEDSAAKEEPKWRTNYGKNDQGQHDLLLKAFKATGKSSKKFATHNEQKKWAGITMKFFVETKGQKYNGTTNCYSKEYIEDLIEWAKGLDARNRFAKFLSAVINPMNIERHLEKQKKAGKKQPEVLFNEDGEIDG